MIVARGWLGALSGALACLVGCAGHDPQPPTAAERGSEYVTRRGCANCHQSASSADRLSGNETALLGRAHAPNLTPDRQTGLGPWSDDQIARAIRDGFALDGAPLCLQMPRFSRMSDREVLAIIAYLRSLPPVHHDVPISVCPPVRLDPAADAGADAGGDARDEASPEIGVDASDAADAVDDATLDAAATDGESGG